MMNDCWERTELRYVWPRLPSILLKIRELEDDFEIAESNARRILNRMLKENLVEEFKKPGEHAQRKFFRLKDVL